MGATWGWRRWIAPGREDEWIARLEAFGCATWTLTERVDRTRVLVAVYDSKRETVVALREHFGGSVRAVKRSEWLSTKPVAPTRVSADLEIVHGGKFRKETKGALMIPMGLAFGSGEHATTLMLLRALARESIQSASSVTASCSRPSRRARTRTTQARLPFPGYHLGSVLDLGTGSGVLALAARKLGARKIVATDFDAAAMRTARENEALNFTTRFVRWQRADVKKLSAKVRYDLVLANLFSGILCEAARQIAASVATGGRLWQSGVLKTQQGDVVAAYRKQGLTLERVQRRGKWVMLQWRGL